MFFFWGGNSSFGNNLRWAYAPLNEWRMLEKLFNLKKNMEGR